MDTLLIITSRYPHAHDSMSGVFVHSQVQELKRHFKRVVVICTIPYIPTILSKMMAPNRKADSMARDYSYDNVDVYFVKNIVSPIQSMRKQRGYHAYAKVRKLVENLKIKPDIVHAHYAWPSGYIAMKLKEDMKWPYFITAHGYDIYDLPFREKYYLQKIRKILNEAAAVISVSNENKQIMLDKIHVTQQNIQIIPNGYNNESFKQMDKNECRKKLHLPIQNKIILTVGYLAPEKGQHILIKSANSILQKRKDVAFILVGDGVDRKMLLEKIKEFGIQDRFILAGKKPHNEIPIWMNAADILAIPSLQEGVPSVLFEALGCGIPIVSTNVGGIPDIIKDDKCGILVPSEDPDKFTHAINNALSRKWNTNYIMEYSKNFTWAEISNSILNLYQKLHTENRRGENTESKN